MVGFSFSKISATKILHLAFAVSFRGQKAPVKYFQTSWIGSWFATSIHRDFSNLHGALDPYFVTIFTVEKKQAPVSSNGR